MTGHAFFGFEELPLGPAEQYFADGEAEVRFTRDSDEIVYADVTCVWDRETGDTVEREFGQAEVAAALEKHRRRAIESAIIDAEDAGLS